MRRIQSLVLFCIVIFFNLVLSGVFYAEEEAEKDWKQTRKAFYSYFMKSYEKEASYVKALWRKRYGKMVLHRKHWEIQFRRLSSQGRRPDCVPTCIAILCDYYNVKHDPPWKIGRRIRTKGRGRISGTSIYNTVEELKNVGLNVCVYPGSLNDLKEKIEAGIPILVIQQHKKNVIGGHARIVIGFNDMAEEFTVVDPNFGNKKCYIKYEDFMELWESFSYCTILAFK